MTALAEYTTPQSEAAFLRHLRQQRAELNRCNPVLMKRLRKLSDAELDAVELALRKLMPQSPTNEWQIKTLEQIAYHRAHPRTIKRRRYKPRPEPVPDVQANLSAVPAIAPPTDLETLPTTPASPADGVATPNPEPSNVIQFHGKAFHGGRELGSKRWIGGE